MNVRTAHFVDRSRSPGLSPEQELKIDNLIAECRLILLRQAKQEARYARIEGLLSVIMRSLAVPQVYSHRETCALFGRGPKWGYLHPEMLPPSLSHNPFSYSSEAVWKKLLEYMEQVELGIGERTRESKTRKGGGVQPHPR